MAADLYRLVWTRPDGRALPSEPTTRQKALADFDASVPILAYAFQGRGRLRVLREADYQKSRST